MNIKTIMILAAMVALPSAGFSDASTTSESLNAKAVYLLDSQPGQAYCQLSEKPEQIDKGFTYFHHDDAHFVSHSSLIKIIQTHDIKDLNYCFKDTTRDSNYLSRIKTQCYLLASTTINFSDLDKIVNKYANLSVNCGSYFETKITKYDDNGTKIIGTNEDEYCVVSSTTPYAENQNLQKIFKRDECSDIKILNPKSD